VAHNRGDFRLAAVHPKRRWSNGIFETESRVDVAFMFERDRDNFIIIVCPKLDQLAGRPTLSWDVTLTQRHGESTLEEVIEVSRISVSY
jgi:hypothetical protein